MNALVSISLLWFNRRQNSVGFINNLTTLGSEVEMAIVNIWIVMLFFY